MQEKRTDKLNKLTGSGYRALFWSVVTHFFIVYFSESSLEIISWVLLGSQEYEVYENFITAEMFICIVSLLISRGACALAAAAMGKNDEKEYRQSFSKAVSIALAAGVIIAAGRVPVIALSADSGHLTADLAELFYITLLPVFYVFRDFVFLNGDIKTAVSSGLIYGAGAVLTSLLLSNTGMGTASIVSARFISMLMSFLLLFKSLHQNRSTKDFSFRPDLKYAVNLVRGGAPTAIGYLVTAIWTVIYASVVSGDGSGDHLYFYSGNTIIMFYTLFFIIVFSMMVTIQTGPLAGEGAPDKAHEKMKRILAAGIGFGSVSGIIFFFLVPFVVSGLRVPDTGEADIILAQLRFSALLMGAYPVVWSLIQYFSIIRQRKKSYMLIGGIIGFYLLMGASSLIKNDAADIMIRLEFALMPAVIAVWGLIMFRREKTENSPVNELKEKAELSPGNLRAPEIKTLAAEFLYTVVIAVIMTVTLMGSYQAAILPDISNKDYFYFENRSRVVANDGVTLLADNYFPGHELAGSLEETGPYLGEAVIAREDIRFYRHHGVDYKSLVRAFVSTVTTGFVQGGSTISMQLIKNTVLSNSGQMRTIIRKISEVMLAIRLERCCSKDEILLMYLNNVNFGKGYYGVTSAARHYFRKEPAELSLAEAVSLSCLSQHPNDYEMAQNSEFALLLRDLTLTPMVKCGFISEEERLQANEEVIFWNPYEVTINYSNVTPTLKTLPVFLDGDIYMTVDDISRFFDTHLYTDNSLLTTMGMYGLADLSLCGEPVSADDIFSQSTAAAEKLRGARVMERDGIYYLPINRLSELYGIDITVCENALMITSRDRTLKSAVTGCDSYVRYINSEESYAVGTVPAGSQVFVQDTDGDIYDGWSRIRTQNALTGYVESSSLYDWKTIAEAETTGVFLNPPSIIFDMEPSVKNAEDLASKQYKAYNCVAPVMFGIVHGQAICDKNLDGFDEYLEILRSAGYEVMPTFRYIGELTNGMDMDETSRIMNSRSERRKTIDSIVSWVKAYDLKAINIDYENMYMEDAHAYACFIAELKTFLQPYDCLLTVDVTVPDCDEHWSGAYNYYELGSAADYVLLMAYDESTGTGRAGSNSDIPWIKKALDKLIKREMVDPGKIILTLPQYMNCFINSRETGYLDRYSVRINKIDQYLPKDAKIIWLEDEQQYYSKFKNEKGEQCEIWIEDPASLSVKMKLVSEFGLAGTGYWTYGFADEETEKMISGINRVIFP